ncbi:hypothetical protein OJ998_01815 [Solirubrobacter taibaiensis]|nr:hypothetical protein [Solirubrobacter taibaiensis]
MPEPEGRALAGELPQPSFLALLRRGGRRRRELPVADALLGAGGRREGQQCRDGQSP